MGLPAAFACPPQAASSPLCVCAPAGGTALSMNWDEVGRKDYSKKGKDGDDDDDDDDWAARRRQRG